MSTTLPHGIIQINEGNIAWYGDITANWQLIDSKIGVYDAAVASIPAPANNGTLTINYGGTTIAPGDGTLTVIQGVSTLGSFRANQGANSVIAIPAPGAGVLTVTVDGITAGTFSANQSTNTLIALTSSGGGADVQPMSVSIAHSIAASVFGA